MKKINLKVILFLLIISLSILLRFIDLGKIPASLNWDEVSLGYNAYSIHKTGKDEYGAFLPVVMRSYDDYKPALYTYFTIPFVALMGLTEQAVRFPSASAGVITVILIYFLVLEILGNKKITVLGKQIDSDWVALLTSFYVAISPWNIQFSRIAFESNVGLTVNILAFLLFLKGIKKNYLLPVAFGVAALNIHIYQSERVFSPLLIIILSVIFYKKLKRLKRWFFFSLATAFLVALPLILFILSDSRALMRARGVSIFSEQTLVHRSADKLLEDERTNNVIGKILDNRRIEFVKATVSGYISHFDINWLFVTGDIARHHAPNMGLLYLFQLPFLLIGIYILVFLKIEKNYKIAFFAYFLLVPIPASITSGVPHAVRTMNFIGTWELFIAIGSICSVIFVFKQKNIFNSYIFKTLALIYMLIAMLNFMYYLNQYFVQLNFYTAKDWLYGYKQAIAYTKEVSNNYQKIVVENEVPFDQSYMFYLFYLKIDPATYQRNGGTSSGGFRQKHKGFGKYVFEHIESTEKIDNTLYVGKLSDMENMKIKKIISLPNGEPAVAIAEK